MCLSYKIKEVEINLLARIAVIAIKSMIYNLMTKWTLAIMHFIFVEIIINANVLKYINAKNHAFHNDCLIKATQIQNVSWLNPVIEDNVKIFRSRMINNALCEDNFLLKFAISLWIIKYSFFLSRLKFWKYFERY